MFPAFHKIITLVFLNNKPREHHCDYFYHCHHLHLHHLQLQQLHLYNQDYADCAYDSYHHFYPDDIDENGTQSNDAPRQQRRCSRTGSLVPEDVGPP
jgi:hypothetical protein